jgi:hypothetical protein
MVPGVYLILFFESMLIGYGMFLSNRFDPNPLAVFDGKHDITK